MDQNPRTLDAAALDEALRLIAPIISHEIRNPMAVIGNSAYFIKAKLGQGGPLDPKVIKHLGIVEAEIRHANEIIGELLSYARMPDPAPAPQGLNALVDAALQTLPKPDKIELKRSAAPAAAKVVADPALAAPALRHLVRNAYEALLLAEGSCVVKIKASVEAGFGVFEVSDNGPGLSAEARAKLFQPFNAGKPRGIGLGLAFVRKVAEHYGGTAWVDEHGAGGAAILVSLPSFPDRLPGADRPHAGVERDGPHRRVPKRHPRHGA